MCLPHHGKISSHRFATNTNMTWMHTFFTSNTPAISPTATGLASSEVYIGRLPRPSLAVFDRSYGGAHQSLDCNHLAYCDLARERQQRAYELVHEQHALTGARVNRRNSTLSDALLRDILILGNRTNSGVSTQPRARSPSPKVNITSREPTDSSLTMFYRARFLSAPLTIGDPHLVSLH